MKSALTLYFDRSLGSAFPRALQILRVQNVIHQHMSAKEAGIDDIGRRGSIFQDNATDDEWLSFVGKRGWVAFTQDYKMHLEPAPLAAIREHGVKVFYLWGSDATRWEKMRVFAKAYDRIIETACSKDGPFVFRVLKDGTLKDILLHK